MPKLNNAPTCPFCFASLDGYTPADDIGKAPEPGDITVCSYCLQVLQFTDAPDGLGLAPATPDQEKLVDQDVLDKAKWQAKIFSMVHGLPHVKH